MFELLSEEVTLYICGFLLKRDLARLALVCSYFKKISEDNSLWQNDLITPELIKKAETPAKVLFRFQSLIVHGNYLAYIKEQKNREGLQFQLNWGMPTREIKTAVLYSGLSHSSCTYLKIHQMMPSFANKKLKSNAKFFCTPILPMGDTNEPKELYQSLKITNNYDCIIIFNQDQKSLVEVCDNIAKCYENKAQVPFIFLMNFSHANIQTIASIPFLRCFALSATIAVDIQEKVRETLEKIGPNQKETDKGYLPKGCLMM